MTPALWYPDAVRRPEPDNGDYTGGPPKGLLHSTEAPFGDVWASYQPGSRPHIEAIGITASRTVAFRQFYPRDMPSRSLQDTAGAVRTNRDGVFQIELGFKAAKATDVPDWFWDGLAPLLRWVEDEHGVDPDTWATFAPYPAVLDHPVRFSSARWDDFNGWCGHQHAPENTHGDPGLVPVARLKRGDWFDMATKAELREVLDAVVSADNPSFVNAVRIAIESERVEDAAAVWQSPLVNPLTGEEQQAGTFTRYATQRLDRLKDSIDAIKAKLGA